MSAVDRYDATPDLEELGPTHLVGIGGAGMSVVAELLAARGVPVQGSDARDSAVVVQLREAGIPVTVGHDAGAVDGARTVVLSSAVRDDNPELVAARAQGLRVLHRSQALAALMVGRRGVAVAGAHGKTTTSAMVATILRGLGEDPSFAVGGSVLTDDGALPGGHLGRGDVLVAEADESDGSFLAYAPTVALVTNVEPDHLDHYGTREAFDDAFVAFAARVVPGGALVACADDPGSASLAARHREGGGTAWTYGTDPASDLVVEDVRTGTEATATLRVHTPGLGGRADLGAGTASRLVLRVPGAHNVLNAAGAVLATVALGAPLEGQPLPPRRSGGPGDGSRHAERRTACASSTTTPTTRPRSPPCWRLRATWRATAGSSRCSSPTCTRGPARSPRPSRTRSRSRTRSS
ncbi:hypothetical protein GCM10025864_41440 [Luteimicrobium album]|uniref:UDP-N-acetylmuramate--L-alanine ligase n=1 Tax=Luteimicrobium album TaxID=1054550 RepID=A0ABQ6I9I9_9MICO|nr:hypothetical protein GCM10025864_41440 [Luteimicrobium album]